MRFVNLHCRYLYIELIVVCPNKHVLGFEKELFSLYLSLIIVSSISSLLPVQAYSFVKFTTKLMRETLMLEKGEF